MSCAGCFHTFHESLDIFSTIESALLFFQSHKVFPSQVFCHTCHQLTKFNPKILHWKCQRTRIVEGIQQRYNFTRTLKSNTWLEGTHLDITTLGKFITYYLLLPPPHHDLIKSELQLSDNTVVKWSRLIRELELQWCLNNTSQVIGGPNTIVEIDEAKFGRRKYNRGRKIDGKWVFGGVQLGTPNIFLEVVDARDQETLMEVIHRRILPGTTIISDGWKSYGSIAREGIYNLISCTPHHCK